MSAFIVDKAHIDLLLTAAQRFDGFGELRWYRDSEQNHTSDILTKRKLDRIGRILWEENLASVWHRYPGDESASTLPGPNGFTAESPAEYEFDEIPGKLDIATIFKAIACFKYQSCEHPGWKTSEAKRFCAALAALCQTMLPGYESAPWEFSDRRHFLKAAES